MSDEVEFVPRHPEWGWKRILAAVLTVVFALWVMVGWWPGLYSYEHTNGTLVRIERLNGGAEILTDSGWTSLTRSSPADSTR